MTARAWDDPETIEAMVKFVVDMVAADAPVIAMIDADCRLWAVNDADLTALRTTFKTKRVHELTPAQRKAFKGDLVQPVLALTDGCRWCGGPIRYEATGLCQRHYHQVRARLMGKPARTVSHCSEPGCDREVHSRGLCTLHDDRLKSREAGRRTRPAPRPAAVPARCSEADCDRQVLARGLCGKHYQRLRWNHPELFEKHTTP